MNPPLALLTTPLPGGSAAAELFESDDPGVGARAAPPRWRVLVVEPEAAERLALARSVEAEHLAYDLVAAPNAAEARRRLAGEIFDVVLLSDELGESAALEVLAKRDRPPVIFLAAAGRLARAVEAIRAGAADYLLRDPAREHLRMLPLTVARVVRNHRQRRALLESRRFCQTLMEQAPIGHFLTTRDGRVLRTNRASEALLGYAEAEWRGEPLARIFPPLAWLDFRRRLARLEERLEAAFLLEAECTDKAGRALRLRFNVTLVEAAEAQAEYGLVQVENLTEIRRAEEALRGSETRVRQQFEAIPEAVLATDAGGRITNFNRAMETLWGRPPRLLDEADRACRSLRLFEPDGLTAVPAERGWIAESLRTRRAVRDRELVIEFAGGNRRQVLASSSPVFGPAGALEGAIVVLVDITERRRLEQKQALLEARLQHAARLDLIGALAGRMAHEFNNQLTAILLNLQLIEAELPPQESLQSCFRDAIDTCRRAAELVGRLLMFTRQAPGPLGEVHLPQVIEESLPFLRTLLGPGIELGLALDRRCPAVRAQAGELRDVLLQLGLNAARAMPAGRGRLEIALTQGVPPELGADPQLPASPVLQVCVHYEGPSPAAVATAEARDEESPARELLAVQLALQRCGAVTRVESSPLLGTTVRLFFPAGRPDR